MGPTNEYKNKKDFKWKENCPLANTEKAAKKNLHRMTHTMESITFPETAYVSGNNGLQ